MPEGSAYLLKLKQLFFQCCKLAGFLYQLFVELDHLYVVSNAQPPKKAIFIFFPKRENHGQILLLKQTAV